LALLIEIKVYIRIIFTEETKHPTDSDVLIAAVHSLTTSVRGAN